MFKANYIIRKIRFNYDPIIKYLIQFQLQMLFNSSQKPMNNSTLATSTKSNKLIASKQSKTRQNFFVFCWKKISAIIATLWTQSRKFMWVGSTGFIILVVPFVFAYIQQIQNQMARLMAMQQQSGRGF